MTVAGVLAVTTIAAGQAKAQFLRLLKDVETKRETVIVTKHGREVAKLVPMDLAADVDPLDRYLFRARSRLRGTSWPRSTRTTSLSGIQSSSFMSVLNTRVAIWITTDRSQLSNKAAAALRQAGREKRQLAISTSTL